MPPVEDDCVRALSELGLCCALELSSAGGSTLSSLEGWPAAAGSGLFESST